MEQGKLWSAEHYTGFAMFHTDIDPRIRTARLRILDPAIFFSGFQDADKNKSLKIKRYPEVTKLWKSRFFVIFMLVGGRIRIREALKLTTPDPQHCFKVQCSAHGLYRSLYPGISQEYLRRNPNSKIDIKRDVWLPYLKLSCGEWPRSWEGTVVCTPHSVPKSNQKKSYKRIKNCHSKLKNCCMWKIFVIRLSPMYR